MMIRDAMRRRLAATTANEGGFTLIEIIVVSVIMTIVMVIFTAGISQAFSAESKVDTSVSGDNQLVIAFQRLDKQVQYSSAISNYGTVVNTNFSPATTDPVIDWLTTNTGTPICTELRINTATGLLQQRTWTQNASPLVPSGWQTLAAGISAPTQPFVLTQPVNVFQYQRLEIAITSTYGVNSNKSVKTSDITFTALNTSSSTAQTSAAVCTQARGVAW